MTLARLHEQVARRVDLIRQTEPEWPCARGCDLCCTRLADVPRLTAAEWQHLQPALARLDSPVQQRIREDLAALQAKSLPGPLTCPLLDRTSGACLVYGERPIACRTYGFYVQRDGGLYCGEILRRVETSRLDHIVWGNQDAIDRELSALGPGRSLAEWFLNLDEPPR